MQLDGEQTTAYSNKIIRHFRLQIGQKLIRQLFIPKIDTYYTTLLRVIISGCCVYSLFYCPQVAKKYLIGEWNPHILRKPTGGTSVLLKIVNCCSFNDWRAYFYLYIHSLLTCGGTVLLQWTKRKQKIWTQYFLHNMTENTYLIRNYPYWLWNYIL